MKKSIILLAIALVCFSQAAVAGENVSYGTTVSMPQDAVDFGGFGLGCDNEWRIKPGFAFKSAVDTNVYKEQGDVNPDVIFSYAPSVALKREGTKVNFQTDYTLRFDQYFNEAKLNAFNHLINNKLEYKGERVKAKAYDRVGIVTSNPSTETTGYYRIVYNNLWTEGAYDLTDKVSGALLFETNLTEYQNKALARFSYNEYHFGLRPYYHWTEKTDIYLEGRGSFTDYYRGSAYDSAGASILLGTVGRPTEKVRLSGNAGFKTRNYSRSEVNGYDDFVFEGIARYQVSPKLGSNLTLKRDIAESVYSTMGYYGVTKYGLDFDYLLTRLLTGKLGASLQHNKYPSESNEDGEDKKRKDDILATGARLIYGPFHNVSLELGYALNTRNSNFSKFQYVDHYIDTMLSYKFE